MIGSCHYAETFPCLKCTKIQQSFVRIAQNVKNQMENRCLKMHKDAIYSHIWLTWIH